MSARVAAPPANFIVVDAPTTPEVVQGGAVVRSVLERNRTADGRLRLGATLARLLCQQMERHEDLLSGPDRELLQALAAFTDRWNEMERRAWRALTFHQARTRRTAPPRMEDRRREPQAREGRPSRRVRTAAMARGSPSSSQSDDDPHDLNALPGFRAAVESA